MTVPVTHKVQGSLFKITIASVLTTLPGLENLELDLGENETYENLDISGDYKAPVFSGVRGEGSGSADMIRDPLGAEQQALQTAYNTGATLVCSFTVSASGVVIPLSIIVTKLPLSGKKGEGFMGKFEFKLASKADWNTSDPA